MFIVKYVIDGYEGHFYGEWHNSHWHAVPPEEIQRATRYQHRTKAIAHAERLDPSHKPEVLDYDEEVARLAALAGSGPEAPPGDNAPEA